MHRRRDREVDGARRGAQVDRAVCGDSSQARSLVAGRDEHVLPALRTSILTDRSSVASLPYFVARTSTLGFADASIVMLPATLSTFSVVPAPTSIA